MKLKIKLIALFLSMFLFARSQDFVIKGKLDGAGSEKITLKGTKENITVAASNGMFELRGAAQDEPLVAFLTVGSGRKTIDVGGSSTTFSVRPLEVIISPGAKLNISGSSAFLSEATVSGDTLNEDFTRIRKFEEKIQRKIDSLTEKRLKNMVQGIRDNEITLNRELDELNQSISASRKRFILEHPGDFASIYYLSLSSENYRVKELESLYNGLSDTYKGTRYGKNLAERIESIKSVKPIGVAQDFTKPDVNGKMVSLSQFRGKYVLIDFWGSWCGACRAANPHLKELYATYASKGFEIVGVSNEKVKDLTKAQELWKKAIKEDGVPWVNLINNEKEMKQDVPKMYGVRSYPTHILLDKEGNILGRWVGYGGKELADKLDIIFN